MSTDTHVMCDSCDGEVFELGNAHIPVDTVVTHVECQLRELAKVRADAWREAVRPVAEARARLAEVEAERDAANEFSNYYRDMAVERGKIMEAARPVVEAAAEITTSGDMPTTLMWVRLATAVDLYRSATSDHPSTTEEKP